MNRNLDGTPFLEGIATIKEVVEDLGDGLYRCNVVFKDEEQNFQRVIDANLQRDIEQTPQ